MSRRGNYENDIMSILFYAAKAAGDPTRKYATSGYWVSIRELSQEPPQGTGIPRSTLNYIFWFEKEGVVVRQYEDPSTGERHAKARFSVVERIAAKYGIQYKIRRVHVYENGAKRVPCDCGNQTDEWEITAAFVEPPKDADWERFVDEAIFDGSFPDNQSSSQEAESP